MNYFIFFIFTKIILCFAFILLEQPVFSNLVYPSIIVRYILETAVLIEFTVELVNKRSRKSFLKENPFSFILTLSFLVFLFYNDFIHQSQFAVDVSIFFMIFRTILDVAKLNRIATYIERFTKNPAKMILGSFLFVIFLGTILLMMKSSNTGGNSLMFMDALFMSSSAVCVSGACLVDISSQFTLFGKIIIMLLIQIGGLGMMTISYFSIFAIRKRVSLEDKVLLSYMLSEDDSTNLKKSIFGIILSTFFIETVGAFFLFIGFYDDFGFTLKNLFYSVFHSISAFCNAGFALFPDSLESFRLNPVVTYTVSFLIIFGGIGFALIVSFKDFVFTRIKHIFTRDAVPYKPFSLNSRIVLKSTAFLLIVSTLLIYIMEHDGVMREYGLFEQYTAAFFQAVTLRTAGFNSIPFATLKPCTYIVMCMLIFIGGASGSTAGGVKINTMVVILAALKSFIRGEKKVIIENYEISAEKILNSFMIFFSNVIAVVSGITVLAMTEKAPFLEIMLEVFAVVGAAGFSLDFVFHLSFLGKCVLIGLMIFARLGALTMMSVASKNSSDVNISWPAADISIG